MEKIIVVGKGGFGKEVIFLLNRTGNYKISGIVDDDFSSNETVLDIPLLGTVNYLLSINEPMAVIVAIANPDIKKKITEKLKYNPYLYFPNVIDPTALLGMNIEIGVGNIIMPYTTFTSEISIKDFNMINIHTSIGHDVEIGSFNSIFPNVSLSGNVKLKNQCLLGVGTKIIPNIQLGNQVITGAGSVIIDNVSSHKTVVGVPAKVVKDGSRYDE